LLQDKQEVGCQVPARLLAMVSRVA
jgi:hypothetical protein